MKILCIGDPHFKAININDTNILIKNVIKIANEEKPDFIVVLGDILDTHEKVHTLALKQVTRFFLKLKKITKTFVLIGNHDYINNSQFLTNNHSFNSFKIVPNLVIVDKPIKYQNFVFVPYTPPGRLFEALDYISDWKNADIIFGHQEMYGCLYSESPSTNGDVWSDDYPLFVSGHCHSTFWIGKNVYYPGASTQVKINETDPKTVSVININSNKKLNIKTIPLNIPIKKTIYLDMDQIKNFVTENNTIYRIILKCESTIFNQFKKTELYKKLISQGFKITYIEPEKEINMLAKEKKNLIEILGELIKDDSKYVKKIYNELCNN